MTLAIEIQKDWLDYVEALGSIGGVVAAALAVGVAAFVSWRIALADSQSNDGRFTIELLHQFRHEYERFFAFLESDTAVMIQGLLGDGDLLDRLQAILDDDQSNDHVDEFVSTGKADQEKYPDLALFAALFGRKYALVTRDRPSGLGGTEISAHVETLRSRLPLFFELMRYAYLLVVGIYHQDTSSARLSRLCVEAARIVATDPLLGRDESTRLKGVELAFAEFSLASYWHGVGEGEAQVADQRLSYVELGGKLISACDLLVSMYSSLSPRRVHERSVWERKQSGSFFDPSLVNTPTSQVDRDIRDGTVQLARSFKKWLPAEQVSERVSEIQSVLSKFRAVESPGDLEASAGLGAQVAD